MSTRADDNRRLLMRLGIAAVAMFGFGFALVPFYEAICQVTGLRNILQPDDVENTQVDETRRLVIEFDANTHDLAWRFRPLQTSVDVHPGQLVQVAYEVTNTRDVPVTGQAVPSYGPQIAGSYFKKVNCFCFEQQTLAAGETRTMPVLFVVDPKLPDDVHTITLSYTFFEVAGTQVQRAGNGGQG
ncbi:cytochrome c oxidase assembly protein [Denitromonas iodatirespirans]|uniref:Cytochrome c oxidase assembly protein CtaG n=1 Tax=Denitromonas iodatirespirans TaxID=2795389 RepID=A0A944H8L7_DENI1|nr:cytochrome c oxidase assembly protein [Denitromonas iodatirespirans]MBT0962453.1 cytochrome c oxidase assembly protein [Denitromonas iodatirespirans]